MRQLIFFLLPLAILLSCKSYVAQPHDYPDPVDTTTRPIEFQEKKTYSINGIHASNEFDGARLNGFEDDGQGHFKAAIAPENTPINHSPYYAFKIWADAPQEITLELDYTYARHRYWPKLSPDGESWTALDSSRFELAADTVNAFLRLPVGPDTLWVAAQEIANSGHVRQWCEAQALHPDVKMSIIGQSKMGRDLPHLDIGSGSMKKKEVIVILSRQHPPEVTGYMAMQAFVEEILADNPLANAFRQKYRVLVYPLLNPDGVDLGHWRHNAGGIDLNRDWAFYHQPETRQVADHIVRTVKEQKGEAILGLDFHSTWYDVYYTNNQPAEHIPGFKDYWLIGIGDALATVPNEKPSAEGRPVSKNWFITQLGAEGITYEIGDSTPRDFIKKKGKVSAREMMKLLILK